MLSFSGTVMHGLEYDILWNVFAHYKGAECEVSAESSRRKTNELRVA